jgi:hypothetical protein
MPQETVKEFEEKANELVSLALDIVMGQKQSGGKISSPADQARDQAVVLLAGLLKLTLVLFKAR